MVVADNAAVNSSMTGMQTGKTTETVPLLVLVSQEEVLHLLPAEVALVLVVAFDRLGLVHRIVQGQQELLEALHYGRRWTQIYVVDVTESDG